MNSIKLRFAVLLAGLLVRAAIGFASPITDANDVSFVVGSGAQRATLILEFNDGATRDSFAWGYLFNGSSVSGAQMLLDVAAADPNLSLTHGGSAASGFFLSSISYFDGTDNHSAVSDFVSTPNQSWGYYLSGGFAGDDTSGPGGAPLAVSGGGSAVPVSWTSSPVGASADSFGETGRLLSDGSWDAWSFGDLNASFSHLEAPDGPTFSAIPEPSVIALLLGAGLILHLYRRRS